MSPSPSPRPGRRAVLGALLAGAGASALGGCSQAVRTDGGRGAARRAAATVTASPSPAALTPDERLLAEAAHDVATASTTLRAVGREHRSLRTLLRPAEQAHRDHLRLLSSAGRHGPPPSVVTPRVPGEGRAALVVALDAERTAARSLGRAVTRAESGALARALASIAASCTQRGLVLAAALDDLPRERRGGRRS